MFHLFLVRFIQIFVGSKICCLSGLKPDLLPGALVETIVQCDLKNLRQIEIIRSEYMLSFPNAPVSTHPLVPPFLASSKDFPAFKSS